ncbi:MAG: hypothetical protein IKH57_10160 [Clostridia bacterium]|nr:hypothetical protein [Clostridia bacterium]
MPRYNWSANAEREMSRSVLDYVNADGTLTRDAPVFQVLVRNAGDLSLLSEYPAGTFAFSKDGKHVWLKAEDSVWHDWLANNAPAT